MRNLAQGLLLTVVLQASPHHYALMPGNIAFDVILIKILQVTFFGVFSLTFVLGWSPQQLLLRPSTTWQCHNSMLMLLTYACDNH